MVSGLICGRGLSGLRSFAVADRGGGDRRVVIVATAERLRSWWLGLGRRLRPFAVDSHGGGGRAAGDVGRGLRVMGSSPTMVVRSRCDRTRREGTPARLYRIKTHGVQFLLGVCVCVCVCPWAPSVSRNC